MDITDKNLIKKFKFSALAAACALALAACGGHHHSHHNDDPVNPEPNVSDVVLEDGTELNVNLTGIKVSFTKTVYDSRPLIERLRNGINEEQLSRYGEIYLGLNAVNSVNNNDDEDEIGIFEVCDEENEMAGVVCPDVPAPVHSVFTAKIDYAIEASKNEEAVDSSGYKLALRNIKADVKDENDIVVSSGMANGRGDVVFAGLTRKGMMENETVSFEAEICIADAEGNILKTQDGSDACFKNKNRPSFETNAYGMYKVALSENASCGLNRIGSVYCWGSGIVLSQLAHQRISDELDSADGLNKVKTNLNDDPQTDPNFVKLVSTPTLVYSPNEISDIDLTSEGSGPAAVPVLYMNTYSSLVDIAKNGFVTVTGPDEPEEVKANALVVASDLRLMRLGALDEDVYVYGYDYLRMRLLNKDGEFTPVMQLFGEDPEEVIDNILLDVDSLSVKRHSVMAAAGGKITFKGNLEGTDVTAEDVAKIEGAVSVSASDGYFCAITGNKELKCFGKLGRGDGSIGSTPENPVHTAVITKDGVKILSGEDDPAETIPIKKIDGENHVFCMSSVDPDSFRGNLYCWGSNRIKVNDDGDETEGGLIVSDEEFLNNPKTIEKLADTEISDFSVSHDHVCAVSDGKLYCWGSSESLPKFPLNIQQVDQDEGEGQGLPPPEDTPYDKLGLGNEEWAFVREPTQVEMDNNVEKVTAGQFRTCAIDVKGDVYCFGMNRGGQLGNGNLESSVTPVKIDYDPVKFDECRMMNFEGFYGEICVNKELEKNFEVK